MESNLKYDTIVIGGGLSGIATALRRRRRGERVLLLEKNNKLGGKLDVLEWEGFRWDKGPSLFTLPHLVDELFELFNRKASDYFNYQLHTENCRYYFEDGTQFTFYSDSTRRKSELEKSLGIKAAIQVENYLESTSQTYDAIGDLFIDAPKLGWRDAFRKDIIKQYPKVISKQMMLTLNGYNERKFSNPKLVQLFNRFGTYNGSNPYKMSGLYSMIPHLELNLGTYFPKGGMRAIIEGLEKLAREVGVEIQLEQQNTQVKKIEDGYYVSASNGQFMCNKLICSIDHVSFYKNIFRDNKALNRSLIEERSSSGLVFYWAVEGKHKKVGLHNILFSGDYKKEFAQIFGKQVPDHPTIYIHNSSAIEPSDAPENGQNWFVMINTPAGVEPTDGQVNQLRTFIIKRVKDLMDIDLESKILFEDKWTMKNIECITGSYQGALYGGAFNSKLSSFKRHGNKSKKHRNLYFTGGSVHPGGGIPLVLKSAKIVDELIERDA